MIERTSMGKLKEKMAFTVDEVSEQTTLSKPFLRLEIKRGKLKVKRFGRRVIILIDDLRDYLNKGSNENQFGSIS